MSRKNRSLAMAAVMSLAIVISGCMSAQQRSAARVIDEATITATVKTKLAADTRLRVFDIDVDTHSGEVTLTGQVGNAKARLAALDIARTVAGVSSVHDKLTLKQQVGAVVAYGRGDRDASRP